MSVIDYERYAASIPENILEPLIAYTETGRPTGGFLEAVLSNDFMDAMKRGDEQSLRAIRAIATFVYMEIPSNAWGSREKVREWIAEGRARGES